MAVAAAIIPPIIPAIMISEDSESVLDLFLALATT